jgi:hypothetical protein
LACSAKFFPKLDLEKANGLDEIVGWLMATSQMNP